MSEEYARAYGMAARNQASNAYSHTTLTGRRAARQMVRDIGEIVAQVEGVGVAASILYQAADAISASLVMPYVEMPPILAEHVEAAPEPVISEARLAHVERAEQVQQIGLDALRDTVWAVGIAGGIIAALVALARVMG